MTNIFDYYDDKTYLAHHGILGQKWGVRRYQNPDGTLTAAGKRRLKPFKNVEAIANKSADKLNKEAESIKDTNKKMHERYDGKEGYKRYIEDAYGGAKPEDYGLSEKDFAKWMKSELLSNLISADASDKAEYEKYHSAAEKWKEIAKAYSDVDVNSITKENIKAARTAYGLYSALDLYTDGLSLDTLASAVNDRDTSQKLNYK